MKQLDINKDGKISFEEFKYWWETGHEGPLGNLVFLRAKSMKLTNSFLAHLSQAGVDLGSFAKDKSDSVSLHMQLGESTKEGMGIKCSVSQGGSQFAERLAALKKECPDLNAGSFNLLVLFGSDSPAPSRAELHSLLTDVFQSAHMPVKFEDFEDNEFVSLKVVKLGSQVGVHL